MTQKYTIITIYKSYNDFQDDVRSEGYSEPFILLVEGKPTDEEIHECYKFADEIRVPDTDDYDDNWNYNDWVDRYKLKMTLLGYTVVGDKEKFQKDVFIL